MTDIAPVPIPSAGKSYNPTYEAHQDELGNDFFWSTKVKLY